MRLLLTFVHNSWVVRSWYNLRYRSNRVKFEVLLGTTTMTVSPLPFIVSSVWWRCLGPCWGPELKSRTRDLRRESWYCDMTEVCCHHYKLFITMERLKSHTLDSLYYRWEGEGYHSKENRQRKSTRGRKGRTEKTLNKREWVWRKAGYGIRKVPIGRRRN